MKKRLVLSVLLNLIFTLNVWAVSDFREESNFYLDSKGINILEVEDKGLEEIKKTLTEYNGIYNIQLSQLMSMYEYELITEDKIYEGSKFLIRFHLNQKELPSFIVDNNNFLWEKLYEDTVIALNISDNYTYAFNKEELIVSNSINLLFETEELKFFENPKRLGDRDEYKRYFTEDNYSYAYMTGYKKANFSYEDKYVTKELRQERVITQGLYNLETEGVILAEAKSIRYEANLEGVQKEIEDILPAFEPKDLPALKGVRDIIKVEGTGYDYLVVKAADIDLARESIVDAIKKYVFLKDRELPVVEEEGRTYIELPLIYKKIYMDIYGEDTIIFTVGKDVLEKLVTGEKLQGLVIENDKNLTLDFEKGFKELEYYDENMFIKVKERI